MSKNVIVFLYISLNMCFGCSKELSHWDGSFEHPQHIIWLRNTKNYFQVHRLISDFKNCHMGEVKCCFIAENLWWCVRGAFKCNLQIWNGQFTLKYDYLHDNYFPYRTIDAPFYNQRQALCLSTSPTSVYRTKMANHMVSMIGFTNFLNQSNHS